MKKLISALAVLLLCSCGYQSPKIHAPDLAPAPAIGDIVVCRDGQDPDIPERMTDKLFDAAVNVGVSRAAILFQQTLNALNQGPNIRADGRIGPTTKRAMCGLSEADMLEMYVQKQADFYRGIVARKPDQGKFLNGWLKRAAWLPE